VWHSTRFARNLKDNITYLDELEKRKVKFYSVQEPMMSGSSGKAMRNLMAVFAEYQSDVTGEHTRSVKANLKKNKQVYCAFPPLGFKNENGKLVRDPNTYQIVDRIFVYRKQGMSMHTIARMLNLRDEKGAKGGKFYASTIQKILNNSIYDNRN
jgi:site-specific DNA recombinase